ncbi:unnamed protein product [Caenorhabditis angaria]|uniref:Smr domain-containing protein n=1 Tax=Caenorhabditis angaria TaxID=860376 RepID=A0A9P1IH89_9PELO|nr:unnamed protein product [Caenorhabditis angaria]
MAFKKTHEQCMEVSTLEENVLRCIKDGHHVVVIIRGVTGSGKTTLAQKLTEASEKFEILFDDNDNHDKISKALKTSLKKDMPLIVIDNENQNFMRVKQYAEQASRHSYEVYCLEPSTTWKYMAEECAKRSSRGESIESISAKIEVLTSTRKITGETLFSSNIKFEIHNYNNLDDDDDVPVVFSPQPSLLKKETPENSISPECLSPVPKGFISLRAEKRVVEKRDSNCQVSYKDLEFHLANVECKNDSRIGEGYSFNENYQRPQMVEKNLDTPEIKMLKSLEKPMEQVELSMLFSMFLPHRNVEDIHHDYQMYGFETAVKLSLEEGWPISDDVIPYEFAEWYENYAYLADSSSFVVENIFRNDSSFIGKLRKRVEQEVLPGEYADPDIYPHLVFNQENIESDEAIARQLQEEENSMSTNDSSNKLTMAQKENLKLLKKAFANVSENEVEYYFDAFRKTYKDAHQKLAEDFGVNKSAREFEARIKKENAPSTSTLIKASQEWTPTSSSNPNPNLKEAQKRAQEARIKLDNSMSRSRRQPCNSMQKCIESCRKLYENRDNTSKFVGIDQIIRDGHSSIYYLDLHFMTSYGAVQFVKDMLSQAKPGRWIEIITGAGNNSPNPSNNIRTKILYHYSVSLHLPFFH